MLEKTNLQQTKKQYQNTTPMQCIFATIQNTIFLQLEK